MLFLIISPLHHLQDLKFVAPGDGIGDAEIAFQFKPRDPVFLLGEPSLATTAASGMDTVHTIRVPSIVKLPEMFRSF
ncbi:MAG: hypothetical protein C1943_06545 [Halochromatium sp.]|nr:hypothetical protein [Halochromatium sp.]